MKIISLKIEESLETSFFRIFALLLKDVFKNTSKKSIATGIDFHVVYYKHSFAARVSFHGFKTL